ncbi:hypothetical protein SRHO_G00210380 [Serrasalmus rhombeus]
MPVKVFTLFFLLATVGLSTASVEEKNPEFWRAQAQTTLKSALSRKLNTNVAKNIVLFLGDGMGITTITAARILKGQLENQTGEETVMTMDTFPYVGLAKVYSVDFQIPDSAATATAYLCGVKTNLNMVGLSAAAQNGVCRTQKGNEVTSILKWAKDAGKSPLYGQDLLPYTTLMYGNGPGHKIIDNKRPDIRSVDTKSKDYIQQAAVPLDSETHGGEDVAVLARGPMAHLFQGVNEQSYLAHAMAYAACVGANQQHCVSTTSYRLAESRSSAPHSSLTSVLSVLLGSIMALFLY